MWIGTNFYINFILINLIEFELLHNNLQYLVTLLFLTDKALCQWQFMGHQLQVKNQF